MASPTPRPGDPLTPVDSTSDSAAPVDPADAADPAPSDAVRADAAPSDAVPVDPASSDAVRADAAPSAAVPVDPAPSDAPPVDAAPSDALPVDAAPSDAVPVDAATSDAVRAENDIDVPRRAADPLRAAAETMRTVRERCVWSQRITHDDLVPYLVEESAELIDAVEAGTRADLREELGDLLWQVLFHSAVAADDPDDPFDIDDVAAGLTEKMVRRHPHVFADAVATTPDEVLVHWNAAKAAEKRDRRSVLDGVSPHMPSLALAQKLLSRAPVDVSVAVPGRVPQTETELGEALLALVAVARGGGWDAERALRGATRRLEGRIRDAESRSAREA